MTIADIEAEARLLCDADTTSYAAADLLRRENAAYEEVVGMIIGMDGTWQFDDSNFTDLPIGRTDLVADQQDYTFDSTHLEIERVEILDKDGNSILVNPMDKSQINIALPEYQKTSGQPIEYDKQGDSIFLYPAPDNGVNVTLTNGLKIYFQRTASVFTSAEVTTGTKTPGFAAPYHHILAYKAALPYCMTYKQDRVLMIRDKIKELEEGLRDHYRRREKDVRKQLVMAGINAR
ncbi:hypothetical protein CMI37_10465 [Candidatus Pacearchaeota archaeon]|mgnify:CR=1 FL=1|nr:hypothetical protein [Candidatus Pacearchaeota archaeon]